MKRLTIYSIIYTSLIGVASCDLTYFRSFMLKDPYKVWSSNEGYYRTQGEVRWELKGKDYASLKEIWIPGESELTVDLQKLCDVAKSYVDELIGKINGFKVKSASLQQFHLNNKCHYYGVIVDLVESYEQKNISGTTSIQILVFLDGKAHPAILIKKVKNNS